MHQCKNSKVDKIKKADICEKVKMKKNGKRFHDFS